MNIKDRWLLPEGIDELMPDEAAQLEILRRKLVDMMQSWGYQLVVPPLVEYLDSLLTGTAKTLDLQTFKLIDQMSGRLLGIRADMTPQVARIAAHKLRGQDAVTRLSYIGSVLHTLPESQGTSRNPIQLGAEIYGHTGPESDMEILQLMVAVLNVTDAVPALSLDIGHVGIYRGLAQYAGLNNVQEQQLFSALQRKALPEIESLLTEYQLSADSTAMLLALAELNGDVTVLTQAQQVFKQAPEDVKQALANLQTVADMAAQRLPEVNINFDLAELRGYDYHTGLVFSAYQAGSAHAVAMGGRYDDIGEDFGYAQPATGFSLDLKTLVTQLPKSEANNLAIAVTWSDDPQQHKAVEELRNKGEVVVYQLPGTKSSESRILIQQDGHWLVTAVG
ncbi:ATP phosphoribosyltransferase regulatory subunit [Methylophaga sp. 42_25_T18]|nr:ATP phosphoribosyltransferase regulatory subunit [Methylophaga sp. 42_25_T18]OUR86186.1 ATP phosphoribosyltransferase regulatory subunit [Methylophaga sp. 42_8_T64]